MITCMAQLIGGIQGHSSRGERRWRGSIDRGHNLGGGVVLFDDHAQPSY